MSVRTLLGLKREEEGRQTDRHSLFERWIYRQIDRRTDRQRQTERQMERLTDGQMDRPADKWADWQTGR